MKSTALVLTACSVLFGCATQPTVDVDYDTTKDFSTLKAYQWMPATGNAASDELLVGRIRNAVDSQLQAKGHTLATDNPDFLIAMQLSGRSTYGGSTGVGMSVGIPVGSRGRISVGGGKSKAIEKKEGTLVLDFLDAKTKSLAWRGTASATAQPNASPEQQQQRVDQVVGELLASFPPKK